MPEQEGGVTLGGEETRPIRSAKNAREKTNGNVDRERRTGNEPRER
jgi:hypothetical protein